VRYNILALSVTVILLPSIATGQSAGASNPRAADGSTTKRVAWTFIGAGLGFGAGLLVGLYKFDEAINSDRKVWSAALVGAVAGGVAGALISRDQSQPRVYGRRPLTLNEQPIVGFSLRSAAGLSVERISNDALRSRVRALNMWFAETTRGQPQTATPAAEASSSR